MTTDYNETVGACLCSRCTHSIIITNLLIESSKKGYSFVSCQYKKKQIEEKKNMKKKKHDRKCGWTEKEREKFNELTCCCSNSFL